jgi:hypothetical protein
MSAIQSHASRVSPSHIMVLLCDVTTLKVLRGLIGRQEFNEATDIRTRARAIDTARQDLIIALAREFC